MASARLGLDALQHEMVAAGQLACQPGSMTTVWLGSTMIAGPLTRLPGLSRSRRTMRASCHAPSVKTGRCFPRRGASLSPGRLRGSGSPGGHGSRRRLDLDASMMMVRPG
jgi:hypothetical protein